MAIEKTQALSAPVTTAIVFNNAEPDQMVQTFGAASEFIAEEVIQPRRGDALKAIEVIQQWQAANKSLAEDGKVMPPLSQVLHNSLVGTIGYEATIVQVPTQLPNYSQGHLEARITDEYVAVTSLIADADSQRLLEAPKTATTSTDIVIAQAPIKLWAEPKQSVHTIGFSIPKPAELPAAEDVPERLSNGWFNQVLKPAA